MEIDNTYSKLYMEDKKTWNTQNSLAKGKACQRPYSTGNIFTCLEAS